MNNVKHVIARTKAGRRFMGFMRTLNKGDDAEIRQLVETSIAEEALEAHGKDIWIAQLLYIRAMSGGLRILQVMVEDEYRVVVLLQAHANERLHIIDMAIEEEHPHRVVQFIQRLAEGG